MPRISLLDPVGPVTGAEKIAVVQDGDTKRLALNEMFAGPGGAAMIGHEDGTTLQHALNIFARYNNILRYIPTNLWAGVAARTNVTDLTAYIQNAIDNTPAGAKLYAPAGTYRYDGGIIRDNSVAIEGDPPQENFDNSWDFGASGTVFESRGAAVDGFTFLPPNAVNSRINVSLRHLTFRGSRVTSGGISGSCVYVNGRLLPGTAVRLDLFDVHFAEAPHHGLFITGEIYGGIIDNVFCHRNGFNGFRADGSVGGAGEIVLGRIRCFQNGQDATGTQQQKANFLWLGGTVFIDMLSASESANGPGAIFGGGPINIGHFQAESNTNDDSLIIGQNGVGVIAFKMGTYMIAPGAGYTHSHFHITQYMTGRADLGNGFHADALGVGGAHLTRDTGAGELTWDVTPQSFATNPVIDDNAGSYNTRFALRVLARDTAGTTDVTGDGTLVTWKPDTEISDTWGAYDHTTGIFTAPISGLYEFAPLIPLAGLGAAHDRSSLFFTSTSFGRIFRSGNMANMMTAFGQFSLSERVTIPMVQGDTCFVQFDVGGGAKTVDTIADASFATMEIRSVG